MTRIHPLVGILLGIFLYGCGARSDLPSTADVGGCVNYLGKPLDTGTVLFVHDSGRPVSGAIGSDGRYKVKAFLGPNKVAINCREPSVSDPSRVGKPDMIMPGKSRIPEKYTMQDSSGFAAEVKSGVNKFDFELKE